MTTWTHGFLALAVFQHFHKLNYKKAVWWAIFPDLFWALPFGVWLLLTSANIPLDFSDAPHWFYILYGLSHSMIISGLFIATIYYVTKKIPYEVLAWPLMHILPDIPGHTHFQTPFLFPVSTFSLHGLFSWTDPVWTLISYLVPTAILIVSILTKLLVS